MIKEFKTTSSEERYNFLKYLYDNNIKYEYKDINVQGEYIIKYYERETEI